MSLSKLIVRSLCLRFLIFTLQIGFTMSSDGTSNKHLDFMSRHVNIKVPDYNDPTAPKQHQNRFLGITGTVDHTSETQLRGWHEIFGIITSIYNDSPLSGELNLSLEELAHKLSGINTDHAED